MFMQNHKREITSIINTSKNRNEIHNKLISKFGDKGRQIYHIKINKKPI